MKLSKPQQTLLIIIAGMILCWFVFKWKGFLFIAAGLLLISFVSPYLTQKIHWLWMKLGEGLGYINSRIILTIVFFLILTPIAFVIKLMGKLTMKIKDKGYKTLFEEKNHQYTKADLENMW